MVIFHEKIGEVAEQYLVKGSQCYIEGQLQTRKWQDKDGNDRWSTEVVLGKFRGELRLLGSRDDDHRNVERTGTVQKGRAKQQTKDPSPLDEFIDDDIPF